MCNGDDSAYYLHKGYRVVGIEASPLLLEPLGKAVSGERYDWFDIHAWQSGSAESD